MAHQYALRDALAAQEADRKAVREQAAAELVRMREKWDADAAAQHQFEVRDLQLRVPTMQGPGAAGGLIEQPLPAWLPPGYTAAPGWEARTTGRAPDFDAPRTKLKRIKVDAKHRRAKVRSSVRR